uniref:Leucine-rich repeat-containing N-terminal plant-type domain-containing protein n=1 Tax=Aegilops tauschii TaxID=37682 RepID=M8CA79_AEGTA
MAGASPLLLLSFLLLVSMAVADQCHDDDHAALVAIDTAMGSPYHFASWTPDSACCDWYDVDCDADTGRVIGLRVYQDTNMSGAIPDAIGNLTFLETLTLHHLPAISGAIPDSLATLSNLSELTISYTGVSGPSPDGAYLQLSHNNLSGAIPTEFAAVNFSYVDLSRNALSGDATSLFGAEKAIQHLDVSRNALNFDLSAVEFPEQLTYADLSHNAIHGSIPAQVATLAGLQQFNVSFNRLCGAVPTGGNMSRFDRYSYLHNKCLCGTPLTACRQRPVGYLH